MAADPSAIDTGRAEAFAQHLTGIVNGGALCLMLSIGHRAGLFDVMGRTRAFATSGEIAREAGLEERYVREWLGAMATGGIVLVDASSGRFRLPPEHAGSLTRDARRNNVAVMAPWIPLLARVEDEILECFERGGGVHYGCFERFHEVMAEASDQTTVAALVDAILPLVPGARDALDAGIEVADVGCGAGRALNALARRFPKSRFTGFDLSREAIVLARTEAAEAGLRNAQFEVRDVSELGVDTAFDLVTALDAIHDQVRPDAVLAGIARALRPDGHFLMQDTRGTSDVSEDAKHPLAPFLYTVSCMHCMTVSLAGGGVGLGAMWGERTARCMLDAAGFGDVQVKLLPHDPIHQYYVARRRR